MAKVHIEMPTSDEAEEIAQQILDGRWRTYCGMEIGVHTVWVSVLHVEETEEHGGCKDCDEHMCKRCRASYNKQKER